MTSTPLEFRGTYVAISRTSEDLTEIAVKGEKWLIQQGPRFILKTNVVYGINPERKTYYEMDENDSELSGVKDVEPGKELTTGAFAWATGRFFQTEAYSQMEKVSQSDNLVIFRRKGSSTEELITVDSDTGMVVKREFPKLMNWIEQGSYQAYKYELRNVTFEVRESNFGIPEGYRLITAAEARRSPYKTP